MIAGSDHTVISKFRSMLLCTGAILHLPYSSPTEFYTCVTHSSNPTNRIHPHSIERLKRSSHAQPPLLSRTEASAHLRTPSPPHSHPLSLSLALTQKPYARAPFSTMLPPPSNPSPQWSATDPASSAIHHAATGTPHPRMPSIPIYLGLGLGLVFFLLTMLCLVLVFFLLFAWLMWKT